MELDAATAQGSLEHTADVAVIGAGPAGLTLARALADRGLTVAVLESGDRPAGAARELNAGETSGDPFGDLRDSRGRALGGTASLWDTVRGGIAGAKYVALDPADFAERAALPWSGWPVGYAELAPWYRAARTLLGFDDTDVDALALGDADHPRLPFRPDGLASDIYLWGPAETFRRTLPDALCASERVLLIRNATVTALVGADRAAVTAATWAATPGARGTLTAARFVVAAGAIENARLLLASGTRVAAGNPWLGGGLMEHPIDRSLRLVSRHPALAPDAGYYAPFGTGRRAVTIGRISCSGGLMRAEGLWNASLRLFPAPQRRLSRIGNTLMRRIGGAPAIRYRVLLDLEQAPHPENRVELSDQRDAFGIRRVAVRWKWRAVDEANRQRVVAAMIREFGTSGAGVLQRFANGPVDAAVHHHAGTTRMHDDPALGVVDADLRVHGIENLYVLGASVFPTAGVANPTLTILALSLRLADWMARSQP